MLLSLTFEIYPFSLKSSISQLFILHQSFFCAYKSFLSCLIIIRKIFWAVSPRHCCLISIIWWNVWNVYSCSLLKMLLQLICIQYILMVSFLLLIFQVHQGIFLIIFVEISKVDILRLEKIS